MSNAISAETPSWGLARSGVRVLMRQPCETFTDSDREGTPMFRDLPRLRDVLLGFLLALPIGFLLGLPIDAGASQVKPVTPQFLPDRPCELEDDARNCFWDAGRRGNGRGYSYWVDRQGSVHFLDPRHNSTAARLEWQRHMVRSGWERWGELDGHQHCYVKYGDTSLIRCWDGYTTTS
jgi:hypothetical protein